MSRSPGAREALESRRAAFEPPEAPTTNAAASSRLDCDDGAACCQKTTALQEGPQDGLDGHDRFTETHKAPPLDEATRVRLHADAAPRESKEAPAPKPPARRFSDGRRSVAQPQEAPRRRDAQARRPDEERGPFQIT